jgi:hypothetical protein
MSILDKLRQRLETDYGVFSKWYSARIVTGGALFAAIAFALSLSSAGMQFLGVFGIRAALAICLIIFVCAFIGRIWKQGPPSSDGE